MTRFLLIRHGDTDAVGHTLAGRLPGTHLNERGRRQAEQLARWLGREPIHHLYSSPLERARETAGPLARQQNLEVQIAEALQEIDFGAWTGRAVADLAPDPVWQQFNAFRSGTRAPHGEMMAETQVRVVAFLQSLRERHPDETVAVVSHGDVIRSVLLYYLGMPLDFFQRLEINPGSVSALEIGEYGPCVLFLNRTEG